jgi:hypothetical protein
LTEIGELGYEWLTMTRPPKTVHLQYRGYV